MDSYKRLFLMRDAFVVQVPVPDHGREYMHYTIDREISTAKIFCLLFSSLEKLIYVYNE